MSGGLLGTQRDRAVRHARRLKWSHPEKPPSRLTLGPWEPFVMLAASIAALACFVVRPCSSAQPKPETTLRAHEGSVGSVTFRSDESMLASVGTNGSIVLWDLATHQRDSFPPVGPGQNRCVAFSPDSKLLATGSLTRPVAIHNFEVNETRPLSDSFDRSTGAKCLAFAPDGRTLAVGQIDGRITLWNVATRREQSMLSGHTELVSSLAFAPDGRSLVSSGGDRTVRLWDLTTSQPRFAIPGLESMLISFAFTPDSQILVLGDRRTSVVRLWDTATGLERAVLDGPESDVLALAISPDGHTLAAGDYHGLIYSWHLPTLKRGPSRLAHAGIQTLAFAPDGRTLASGGFDGTVYLWDWPPRTATRD